MGLSVVGPLIATSVKITTALNFKSRRSGIELTDGYFGQDHAVSSSGPVDSPCI